jgi:hypothetical protein
MSSLMQLSLENLRELDGGKAILLFQEHLRRAAHDCLDRPADKAKRKVTLEVTLEPDPEPDGTCDRVTGQIKSKSALPVHQTRPYSFRLHANGLLSFNPDSPDSVDQGTLLSNED